MMMRMTKVLALAVVLTGCLSASTFGRTVRYFWPALADEVGWLKASLAQFEKQNPNVKVQVVTSADWTEFETKMALMLASNTPPDVVYYAPRRVMQFAAKKMLVDIQALSKSTGFSLVDYAKEALAEITFNGTIYGLPSDGYGALLYTNETMLSKAGIGSLKTQYEQGTWNWDAFTEVCRKVTKDTNNDGRPEQTAYNSGVFWDGDWPAWIWSNGGDLFSKDRKKLALNSPESIEALEYLFDLRIKFGQSMGDFVGGKTAFTMDGSHKTEVFRKSLKFNWDVIYPPKRKETSSVYLGGGFCIPANAKNKSDGWALARFLTSPEVQESRTKLVGRFPSRLSVRKKYLNIIDAPNKPPKSAQLWIENPYRRPLPYIPRWTRFRELLDASLVPVFNGTKGVKEAMETLAKQVNPIL